MNNLLLLNKIQDTTSADNRRFVDIICPEKYYYDSFPDEEEEGAGGSCYEQIYDGQIMTLETGPEFLGLSCNPPYASNSSYHYHTYKMNIAAACTLTITRPTDPVNADLYFSYHNDGGGLPGAYLGYDYCYNTTNYSNYGLFTFSTPGVYYLTIRDRYGGYTFQSNEFYFNFTDGGPLPPTSELKNIWTPNNKIYIVYKDNRYDLNYKAETSEVATGIYEMPSLVAEIPPEVKMNENTVYPLIIDENESNVEPTLPDATARDNTAYIGQINPLGEIVLDDAFTTDIIYKNKHTLWNFLVLKDLLFTVSDDHTANYKCNILLDTTVVFEDVPIGDMMWFRRNLHMLTKWDVSRVYFEFWFEKRGVPLAADSTMTMFDSTADPYIPFIITKMADMIQNTPDLNCLVFDKYLDRLNQDFDIMNVTDTFKRYTTLLDYQKIYSDAMEIDTNPPTLDWDSMGYPYILEKQYIMSENGYFNKPNDSIYTFVQFVNGDATDYLYRETYLMELLFDGTNYSITNSIGIPFNIIGSTINDAISYGDGLWYIELLVDGKVNAYFIDIVENDVFYQGNLDPGNAYDGLKYYPVKSTQNQVVYLSKLGVDRVNNTDYRIIYNYKLLADSYASPYFENIAADVECPYKEIYLSDDKAFLLVELNEDVYLNNVKNKVMANITEKDAAFVNLNNSTSYFTGVGEVLKVGEQMISPTTIHSDNVLAENNWKSDGTIHTPIISYDPIDVDGWFADIYALEQEVHLDKDVMLVVQMKPNKANMLAHNYPDSIILWKPANQTTFSAPDRILNLNAQMINEYYQIKRFIMKKPETDLSMVIDLQGI